MIFQFSVHACKLTWRWAALFSFSLETSMKKKVKAAYKAFLIQSMEMQMI